MRMPGELSRIEIEAYGGIEIRVRLAWRNERTPLSRCSDYVGSNAVAIGKTDIVVVVVRVTHIFFQSIGREVWCLSVVKALLGKDAA